MTATDTLEVFIHGHGSWRKNGGHRDGFGAPKMVILPQMLPPGLPARRFLREILTDWVQRYPGRAIRFHWPVCQVIKPDR